MNKRLFLIALDGLRGRKKQTIVLMLLLTISFAFLVTTLSVTDSFTATEQEARYETYGHWKLAVAASDLGKDEAQKAEWIEAAGSLKIQHPIVDKAGMTVTTLGMGDKDWLRMGRIRVSSGHFPEKEGEIAMEEDVLSALGYSYELGQSIQLDKTYTLTGILSEYSDLWVAEGIAYPGALLCWTEESAPGQNEEIFTFLETEESYAKINVLLENVPYVRNYLAYRTQADSMDRQLYVILIMATTALAMALIYGMQMKQEIKSVQLLRQIGATKSQLMGILGWKTLFLTIPAMVLGTGTGVALLYLLLHLAEKGITHRIVLQIPVSLIGKNFLLWFVLVFLALFIVQKMAMRGFYMSVKASNVPMELGITLILSLLFSTVLFAKLDFDKSLTKMKILDSADYLLEGVISREEVQELQKVPGVEQIIARHTIMGQLSFEGWVRAERVNEPLMTEQQKFPEGVGVYIQAYDESNPYLEQILQESGIDEQAFWNGTQILLLFTYETEREKPVSLLKSGDSIQLTVFANGEWKEDELELFGTPLAAGTENLTVGGITYVNLTEENRAIGLGVHSYTILASYPLLQTLEKKEGNDWNLVGTENDHGTDVYMTSVSAYANKQADFYATDYRLSQIAEKWGNTFFNERERKARENQLLTEQMLLSAAISLCIFFIVFLLYGTLLYDNFYLQRRKYALLRSVGMSRQQIQFQLLRKFIIEVFFASIITAGIYFGKLVADYRRILTLGGTETFWKTIQNLQESYFCQKEIAVALTFVYAVLVLALLLLYLLQARQVYRGNIVTNLQTEGERE